MPTKKVNYRNDKAVLVRVYVEKPREKKRSSSIQQHHHHHHHHHYYHVHQQEVLHGSASNNNSKGYDRRSGLLMYSRLLRDSANNSMREIESDSANNGTREIESVEGDGERLLKGDDPNTTTGSKKKPKHGGRPAWAGNWKLLSPSFFRSKDQKNEKKKQVHGGYLENGIKKLKVRRGKCFISKVFSIFKCG